MGRNQMRAFLAILALFGLSAPKPVWTGPGVNLLGGPIYFLYGRAELWRIALDGSPPMQLDAPGNRKPGFRVFTPTEIASP